MLSVAIVLPPREAFSPDAAGAVAMVARSHARFGTWPAKVLGRPIARPFEAVVFHPVRSRLWPGPEALRYAAGVAAALRDLRPDLIEVHNRPDVGDFLARRFPAVMLFLHNDPRDMRAARTAGQRARLATRLAAIVGVSAWVAERFGPEAVVLPNGIDLDTLPAEVARESLILFAGRLVADKGADLFVEACGLVLPHAPGWRAEMLGADRFGADSPDTPFVRRLRIQAAEAGVTLSGWQAHEEVLRTMRRAAIVVMPGRWPEPFGLVALEAMACGAALLFAANGGVSEVVGQAGIALHTDQPADLAASLHRLIRDDGFRQTRAAAGLDRAKAFDVRLVAARLDALRDAALAWSVPAGTPI